MADDNIPSPESDLTDESNIPVTDDEEECMCTCGYEAVAPVDNDNITERILDPKSMQGRIYMGVATRVLSVMNERYLLSLSEYGLPGPEGGEDLTAPEFIHRYYANNIWSRMVVRVANKIRTRLDMSFAFSHEDPLRIMHDGLLSKADVKGLQTCELFKVEQLFDNVTTLLQNILQDIEVLIDSQNYGSPPRELTEAHIFESESIFQEKIYLFFVSKVLAEAETPYVCPPWSEIESPGEEGDEKLQEGEILDLNVMKNAWMSMVKQVTNRMLSTPWLSDGSHYLAEDLKSHLIGSYQHKYREELHASKILMSPMEELIENFKERIAMISRDFQLDHPSRKRQRTGEMDNIGP